MMAVYPHPHFPEPVYHLVKDRDALSILWSSLTLPQQASLNVRPAPDDLSEEEYFLLKREEIAQARAANSLIDAQEILDIGAGDWPFADIWQSSVLYSNLQGNLTRAAVQVCFVPSTSIIQGIEWKITCGSAPAFSDN